MPLIYAKDRADAKALARQLLDAAGEERHDEVLTTSDGPLGLAFDVPDDLAQQVLGTGDGRVIETPSEPAADARAEGTSADDGRVVETRSEPAADAGVESTSADDGRVVETPSEPTADAGVDSTSADAGADVSEADAKSDGGSSQPSTKASRASRTSRSGR
ncbi:hypothetical protein ACWD6N_11970 [Micromonospora sp. NPDC005163]